MLSRLLELLSAPGWLESFLLDGIYTVLTWVIAVMLPPMAIFFPLFTLLEDFGYLPRVAFHLDRSFQRACACGKQSLTMCMGFGCNAAGVTGCRIIDSPRERLIAIITHNFVPCNGSFPTMITCISLFFAAGSGLCRTVSSAALLLGLILLGIFCTFGVSRLLSHTILKGIPSSFTLELPPYRRPQIGKVLLRSLLDRTVFVLGRACLVAAPAGALLWGFTNCTIAGESLFDHCAAFLELPGQCIGLDGVILLGFLLGFPANEIVLPIILMGYTAGTTLTETSDLSRIHEILTANGWTPVTALCMLLFLLFHFPCSTTCLTIRKETGSWKWTLAAWCIPTLAGILLCGAVSWTVRLVNFIFEKHPQAVSPYLRIFSPFPGNLSSAAKNLPLPCDFFLRTRKNRRRKPVCGETETEMSKQNQNQSQIRQQQQSQNRQNQQAQQKQNQSAQNCRNQQGDDDDDCGCGCGR